MPPNQSNLSSPVAPDGGEQLAPLNDALPSAAPVSD